MRKNIKLFSHVDLDGFGCNIVANALLNANVDAQNLNYDEINEKVDEFIKNKEYLNYGEIFITDISVNEKIAEKIDSLVKEGYNFKLFDHHPTALHLNKYEWCKVQIEDDAEKVCGTRLLYDYIMNRVRVKHYDETLININMLVENIKKYDTWLWKDKYNDIKPKQLNDLFYILGHERFINNLKNCNYSVDDFIEIYSMFLDIEQEKINRYIKKKNEEIIPKFIKVEDDLYYIGIVFAEQFTSELGNRLSEMNSKYDAIAIVTGNRISYRTIHENINVGKIAQYFGGGGHLKAAGSEIRKDIIRNYISEIFMTS